MIRFFSALTALIWLALTPAQAATLLRDAEVERGLKALAQPILQAAGLNARNMRILVVDDPSLNAFVINSRSIFLHSGLIMKVKTPEELQAVLAHEAAHIANGHLSRRAANFQASRTAAGIGIALSLLAGAAAGDAGAGVGAAIGAQNSAQRNFFAHTRAEETAADQSGVRFMADAGVNPQGAVDVLDLFRGQELLSVGRQDPYVRTHPPTRQRLSIMKGFAAATKGDFSTKNSAQTWFDIVQGKTNAFKRAPSWTLTRTKGKSDHISLMRRAVAQHRASDITASQKTMKALLRKSPQNPFVHELNGYLLFETRQYRAAVQSYKKALSLAPKEPLIQAGYGRALMAIGTQEATREALKVLSASQKRDGLNAFALRDLALAHSKLGQNGMAALVTAERYALLGRGKDAQILAQRAVSLLPKGSTGWQRAQDVLNATKRAR